MINGHRDLWSKPVVRACKCLYDDTTVHIVTADNNSFDSEYSFSHSFNSIGTISYHCKHHPEMTGAIVVVEKY
jgi:plastocyanin